MQYERTAFFDTIIERGLRNGTRFSIDHVTTEEKAKLGITMDRASGKYYLAAYGSPKPTRRASGRRGSQTSSEGGEVTDLPHVVIKEVEDMIAAEIEAAGDRPEVLLLQKHTEAGATRGSKLLQFTVSVRRRGPGVGGGREKEKGEGAGAGPSVTQTADAGAGKVTVMPAAGGGTPRRRGSAPSTASGDGARYGRDSGSPRPSGGRDTAAGSVSSAQSKTRVKCITAAAAAAAGGGGGSNKINSQQDPPKKRKSVAATVFAKSPRIGAATGDQSTPGLGLAATTLLTFGRGADGTARNEDVDMKPPSRLPSRINQQPLPQFPTLVTTPTSQQQQQQFSVSTGRSQGGAPTNMVYSGWSNGNYQQRTGLGGSTGTGGCGQIHASTPTLTGSTSSGMVLSTPPPQSSWHVNPSAITKNDDFGQITARSSGMGGRNGDSGVYDTMNSTGTPGCGGTFSGITHQSHLPGTASFGLRTTGVGSTTIGRMSPMSTGVPDQQSPSILGLNVYSTHVRQSNLTGGINPLHTGTATPWGTSTRISGALGGNREPVDEEDIDFLASFF